MNALLTGLMLVGIGFMWGATWQGDRQRRRERKDRERRFVESMDHYERIRRERFLASIWSQQLAPRTRDADVVDALVGPETYRGEA